MESRSSPTGIAAYGSSRHPFRASLPRHVLRQLPKLEPEVARALAEGQERDAAPRRSSLWRITSQDVKDFLIAYCACLLAAMTFFG